MIKEPHLAVTAERDSKLLGFVTFDSETAELKHNKLNEFLNAKQVSLDTIIGVCCDGESVNTGV